MITRVIPRLPHHMPNTVITRMNGRIKSRRVGQRENRTDPPGRISTGVLSSEAGAKPPTSLSDLPAVSNIINDNYCLNRDTSQLLTRNFHTNETINNLLNLDVKPLVVKFVPSAPGLPQRKGISPGVPECQLKKCQLKSVKGASCVTQLSCVNSVSNVPNVALTLPVGARLQNFWQTWLDLGAGPKVVQILQEGYTLPFRIRPKLTRIPTVISCYANPLRNSYLLEALHQLIDKNAVEPVSNQTSLGFYNRLFLVPKPNNKWRPILDLSNLNQFLKVEKFKMETPETIRTSLLQGEWVTSVDFKDAYFHIPIQEQSRKYLRFRVQDRTYQFKALPFGLSTAPMEFTVVPKEVKLNGHTQGYKNPPVPRQLVGESQIPPNLSPTYPNACQNMPGSRLVGEFGKIRTGAQTNLQLCRLPVRPQVRPGPTDTGPVAKSSREDTSTFVTTSLSGPAVHVPDRSADSHRKTSSLRPTTHETHSVASQEQLASTGISRKGHPFAQVSASSLAMVARGKQCPHRPTITPHKACCADIYRRIKRRVGSSLKRVYCKRILAGTGEQTAHKLSRTHSGVFGPRRVPKSLCRQNSSSSNPQYYSGRLHKQRRGHEVRPSMCPTVENLDLVFPATSHTKSPTHSRSLKCDSRQVIQTGSDHPDRVVPTSRSFSSDMQPMAPASDRPICHEVQPQVASVCLSSSGLPSCSSGRTYSAMGGSGCICLPTDRHIGQSGGETTGQPLQENHSNCPGLAQHALVLGLGDHVQSSPSQLAQPARSVDTAFQPDPSQKSDQPKSPCMAPRATAIKEQGFSKAVAARIEAPQRSSTRSVYEAKWTILTKWCVTNQVDFRSPPVKSVADFLLYLFEDKKLQPSTIEGYRSAIADKLGNTSQYQQR